MKRLLKTLLFILGAPAIMAIVVVMSLVVYQQGDTYSFWPFVGTILTGVFCLIYILTFIITGAISKKKGTKKGVIRQTAALVIIAFIVSAGAWLVIDIPLPGILSNATSGTVLFDHLREDYISHAETHGALIDDFVKYNYDIQNLEWKAGTPSEEECQEYIKQGYQNERIKKLVHENFKSIDQNGYTKFTGPWISFADGGRMTIPTLVHLVTDKREIVETPFYLEYNVKPNVLKTGSNSDQFSGKEKRDPNDAPVNWSVLDMQGGSMDLQIVGPEMAGLFELVLNALGEYLPHILSAVNTSLETEQIVGAPLFVTIDASEPSEKGVQLSLMSATTVRGMHGYMHSAWLNSNHLLFAVISMFPARQWLYILGSWLMFTSIAVGALRYAEFAKDKDDEPAAPAATAVPKGAPMPPPAPRPAMPPYNPYARQPQQGTVPYRR